MMPAVCALPWMRLIRHRPTFWRFLILTLVCLALGQKHDVEHVSAEDAFLIDVFGPMVVPLMSFSIVGACVEEGALGGALLPLKAWGSRTVEALGGIFSVAVVASAVANGLLATVAVLASHGPADGPWGTDMLATVYAASLGGLCHGALLLAGASLGRRGEGRYGILALTLAWALMGSDSSDPSPQGALAHLLGDPSAPHRGAVASAFRLLAFAGVAFAWSLASTLRGPRFGGMALASAEGRASSRGSR